MSGMSIYGSGAVEEGLPAGNMRASEGTFF